MEQLFPYFLQVTTPDSCPLQCFQALLGRAPAGTNLTKTPWEDETIWVVIWQFLDPLSILFYDAFLVVQHTLQTSQLLGSLSWLSVGQQTLLSFLFVGVFWAWDGFIEQVPFNVILLLPFCASFHFRSSSLNRERRKKKKEAKLSPDWISAELCQLPVLAWSALIIT